MDETFVFLGKLFVGVVLGGLIGYGIALARGEEPK